MTAPQLEGATPRPWGERRGSVADRWRTLLDQGIEKAASTYEVRSAVEWDRITTNPQKADYHRRTLLNVIAVLMDALAAAPSRPVERAKESE